MIFLKVASGWTRALRTEFQYKRVEIMTVIKTVAERMPKQIPKTVPGRFLRLKKYEIMRSLI